MNTFYVVIEVQKGDGNPGILTYVYNDLKLAYNKYYTVLAAASVSQLAYHASAIYRSDDGMLIESKVFKEAPEPEVEDNGGE